MKKIIALSFASLLSTSSNAQKIRTSALIISCTIKSNEPKFSNTYKVPYTTDVNHNSKETTNV